MTTMYSAKTLASSFSPQSVQSRSSTAAWKDPSSSAESTNGAVFRFGGVEVRALSEADAGGRGGLAATVFLAAAAFGGVAGRGLLAGLVATGMAATGGGALGEGTGRSGDGEDDELLLCLLGLAEHSLSSGPPAAEEVLRTALAAFRTWIGVPGAREPSRSFVGGAERRSEGSEASEQGEAPRTAAAPAFRLSAGVDEAFAKVAFLLTIAGASTAFLTATFTFTAFAGAADNRPTTACGLLTVAGGGFRPAEAKAAEAKAVTTAFGLAGGRLFSDSGRPASRSHPRIRPAVPPARPGRSRPRGSGASALRSRLGALAA
mmetsp:Transcript_58047/g.104306  ORF Transcript_58047/g.104306 Transcript_58047/m.104306 type:complete len:318 (-) Transcript_58047:134-1087(-)